MSDTPGTDPGKHEGITPEEKARLQAIADLELNAPEVDEVLQELTRQASRALDLPIALVSVVLDGAQYFAASQGLEGWIKEAGGTPVEWSFCQHAVRSKEPLVIEDAGADERVQESPLVTQDGIGCYCGVPLITSTGHAVGTLCVIGPQQRAFTEEERARVAELARKAIAHIESRKSA